MVRFLILLVISITLERIDTTLLYGFVIGVAYSILCTAVDIYRDKDRGDC